MKKTALIAAAFAAISTVAIAGSPAHAKAVSPAHALAVSPADAELLPTAYKAPDEIMRRKTNSINRRAKKPAMRLNPKVCYERKRVGPQTYVIVRRAC